MKVICRVAMARTYAYYVVVLRKCKKAHSHSDPVSKTGPCIIYTSLVEGVGGGGNMHDIISMYGLP